MAENQKNKIFFQLVSLKEIAALIDCSVSAIQRMRSQGDFPQPIKLGSLLRWRLSDIENWLLTKEQSAP